MIITTNLRNAINYIVESLGIEPIIEWHTQIHIGQGISNMDIAIIKYCLAQFGTDNHLPVMWYEYHIKDMTEFIDAIIAEHTAKQKYRVVCTTKDGHYTMFINDADKVIDLLSKGIKEDYVQMTVFRNGEMVLDYPTDKIGF